MPPPDLAADSIALLIAGVSVVAPSPLAPCARTLIHPAEPSLSVPLPALNALPAAGVTAAATPVPANFKSSLRYISVSSTEHGLSYLFCGESIVAGEAKGRAARINQPCSAQALRLRIKEREIESWKGRTARRSDAPLIRAPAPDALFDLLLRQVLLEGLLRQLNHLVICGEAQRDQLRFRQPVDLRVPFGRRERLQP